MKCTTLKILGVSSACATMAPSLPLTILYFLRAVAWMLLMVFLGLVATAIEVLTFPAIYFLDPTLRVYQYMVCLIAKFSLYTVISVKVQVSHPPFPSNVLHLPSPYSLQVQRQPPPLSR